MKKPLIAILSVILGVLFLTFAVLMGITVRYKEKIMPHVLIEGVSVSNLSEKEAVAAISKRYPPTKNVTLVFTFRGESVATVSAEQLEYALLIQDAVKEAQKAGKDSLLSRLQLITGLSEYRISLTPYYNKQVVDKKIKELSDAYYTKPIDARFEFKNEKVTAFAKEQPGYSLDTTSLHELVNDYLSSPATKQLATDVQYVALQLKQIPPQLALKDSNTLGVVELVASGSSHFSGSIAERIYNITIGAQRLNGTIIKKGDTFSFVKELGDISRATGFKPAYIIRNGRTVLDDGGGICQVSTTLFRAALSAGLPIVERHAHAYRVGYYEQDMLPGFDATIYSPTVDLKFTNDYPSALLIQTIIHPEDASLEILLYGTKDNRQIAIGTPVISNQSAPPPAEYIDEPTLPAGTIKQIDFSAPGALSRFSYTVEKNGIKTIDQVFTSQYRPWKAIFLKGTQ